ncbi:MAG: hypothetical protein V4492_08085 [Chlamydiota bacterium]
MKESVSLSTSCETAAVRIHRWIGKDKDALLNQWRQFAKGEPFFKLHKCDLVRPPKIPPQLGQITKSGASLSKRKRTSAPRVITKGHSSSTFKIEDHCSLNQKYPYHYSSEPPLSSERVIPWPFKEHFYVCKHLKVLAQQVCPGPRWQRVVPIKSSDKESELERNPYLEDWGKRTEERQFQITRIIKYLSD